MRAALIEAFGELREVLELVDVPSQRDRPPRVRADQHE
jgi:hypothetical protein